MVMWTTLFIFQILFKTFYVRKKKKKKTNQKKLPFPP